MVRSGGGQTCAAAPLLSRNALESRYHCAG
jgi:hypothetical protein